MLAHLSENTPTPGRHQDACIAKHGQMASLAGQGRLQRAGKGCNQVEAMAHIWEGLVEELAYSGGLQDVDTHAGNVGLLGSPALHSKASAWAATI